MNQLAQNVLVATLCFFSWADMPSDMLATASNSIIFFIVITLYIELYCKNTQKEPNDKVLGKENRIFASK